MKKLLIVLFLSIFVISACNANIGLNLETDVEVDLNNNLFPGNEGEQNEQPQEQPGPETWFRDPVVITLLVILVVILIAFLFIRPRRRPQ